MTKALIIYCSTVCLRKQKARQHDKRNNDNETEMYRAKKKNEKKREAACHKGIIKH